jgi:hypothetical protein
VCTFALPFNCKWWNLARYDITRSRDLMAGYTFYRVPLKSFSGYLYQ